MPTGNDNREQKRTSVPGENRRFPSIMEWIASEDWGGLFCTVEMQVSRGAHRRSVEVNFKL